MNELTKQLPDNTAQVINFPKSDKNIGWKERPHLGMKLFEVYQDTCQAQEVHFKEATIPMKQITQGKNIADAMPQNVIHQKAIFDPKKWYTWAINKENAVRKFKKAVIRSRSLDASPSPTRG